MYPTLDVEPKKRLRMLSRGMEAHLPSTLFTPSCFSLGLSTRGADTRCLMRMLGYVVVPLIYLYFALLIILDHKDMHADSS